MTDDEFEAAMETLGRLDQLPSVISRLAVNGAPNDLRERAERVLQLAVKMLDDVGVLTEMDAIDALVQQWSAVARSR